MDINAKMQLLEQNRKDIGQRIAQMPQQFNPAADPEIQNLRSNQAAKIKELFAHDSQLSQTMFQPQEAPGPHAPDYQAPQGQIVDPLIGLHAASKQQKATAGEIGDILSQIGSRKDYLEDAYKRGLDLLELGIRAKEAESRLIQQEIDNMFKMEDQKQKNADKKKQSTIPELLQYLIADVGGQNPQQELAESLKAYIQKNPSMAQEAINTGQLFSSLSPQQQAAKFGYSVDEGAAGVAGMPKTEPWLSMWSTYAKGQKTKQTAAQELKDKSDAATAITRQREGTVSTPITSPLPADSGWIRVSKNDTGETGIIPASEFNPYLYTKL